MKHYEKPTLSICGVVQVEAIANAPWSTFTEGTPWSSFASSLEDLGGAITSYLFTSGIQINVD